MKFSVSNRGQPDASISLKSKLDELKTELEREYKIKVYTIGKDLSLTDAEQEVYDETKKENIQIE